jgi:hypothetical protein
MGLGSFLGPPADGGGLFDPSASHPIARIRQTGATVGAALCRRSGRQNADSADLIDREAVTALGPRPARTTL